MNKIILLFSFALLLSGCNRARQEQGQEDDDVTIDLPQLKAQGEITAVTLYSSTSYFQYKMQPMGYEYELIKDFARSEGLKLNIKVAESPAKLIEMLEAGEADVVAYPIQISNRMKEKLIYCGREEQDSQVLIQRANKGDKVLTDVTELREMQKKLTEQAEALKDALAVAALEAEEAQNAAGEEDAAPEDGE